MQNIKEIEEEIFRTTCDHIKGQPELYGAIFGHPFQDALLNHGLQQVPEEFAHVLWNLFGLKTTKYSNILEIGVASGYSVLIFNKFLDVDTFTLIDDGKHKRFSQHKNTLSGINYDLFVGDSASEEAVDFVERKNVTFDLIHIDGNHDYDYVIKDFKRYSKFLSDDGVIILHDSLHLDGPRRVLIEMYRLEHNGFRVLCNIGNRFGSAIIGRARV